MDALLQQLEAAFRRYRVALELELRLSELVPLEMAHELRQATEAAAKALDAALQVTVQSRKDAQRQSGLRDIDRAQRPGGARA